MERSGAQTNVITLESQRPAVWGADEHDPDSPAGMAWIEMQWAWLRVKEPSNADDFYQAARLLIGRAHELDAEQLRELAEAIPLVRKRGRHVDRVRWINVWAECFTFAGNIRRGGKMGDTLPSKSDALTWICQKYKMKRGAARKLYEDIERVGPQTERQ